MKTDPKEKKIPEIQNTTESKISKPKKLKNKPNTEKISNIQNERKKEMKEEEEELKKKEIIENIQTNNIDKSQTTFSKKEIENFMKENNSSISGEKIYSPLLTFASGNFSKFINSHLSTYEYPTPIQSLSWPIILDKQNLIAISKTGSGKSFAFIIPAIIHVIKVKPTVTRGPIVSKKKFIF
jgi:ATP-dependent RNA helicase DBP3